MKEPRANVECSNPNCEFTGNVGIDQWPDCPECGAVLWEIKEKDDRKPECEMDRCYYSGKCEYPDTCNIHCRIHH